jgi:WD40 repeat protein
MMSKETRDKNAEPEKERGPMNPFPGLRPFSIEESHLFFGREGQSEEVLRHLSMNRFVAVIGASGSGKSSLIYCGLIPILHGGFITDAGSSWQIITTRPGNNPLENMAVSIAGEGKEVPLTAALLRRSSVGLTDAIRQHLHRGEGNILLIVDQFEELFRFKKSRRDAVSFNESEAYVKLIVQAVRQTEVPVYMVLTMRSDFIGECSQFQELTALINESNYLVPQMTRDDFRDAITGPVAVGGATIDPNLVTQLLNDVGDNPDQLPILQHALMRTWDYWQQQKNLERPLSISDYEAVGRMEKALSEHANEAFEELSPGEKMICESMFKTLTEKGGDNIGIRQPTRVEVIAEIAKATPAEVMAVVEIFRKPGRSFLTPAHPIPLSGESVVDISHESLMRIWDRLKIWVDEEAQAVQMYNRLSEASALFQVGKTGLWRPPDLQLALNWRKKQQPTLTWAERYNPAFERAMVFLETSEKEFIAEEQNKIRLQRRQLRRTRVFAMVLGTAAIISIGLMLWSFVLRDQALKAENEAVYQKSVADSNFVLALTQQQRAEAQADTALMQKERADSNAMIALDNQRMADRNAWEARRQSLIAQDSAEAATRQRNIALQQQQEAERQRGLAEEASDEAYRRQVLSVAQSMAVKSLQVDNDTSLKALLAYQAYLFNQNNRGTSHNADVYAGLYDALKFLNGSGYNVYTGHTDAVRSLVFAPDNKTFFSAGSDGRILKWDIKAKTYSVVIENPMVNRVIDVSDDGKWLACGTDGKGVQLFHTGTNQAEPKILSGEDNRIRTLDFLPDNKRMFSAGTAGVITLWDLESDKSTVFANTGSPVDILVVSRDGKYLAAGTRDGRIIIYEVGNSGSSFVMHENTGNSVLALDFGQEDKLLASGDVEGNVLVWDFMSRSILNNLRGHRARITQLKFSPDGSILATSSNDGSVRMWETRNLNNQPIVLTANAGFVFCVAFSPDGEYVLTGSTDEDRLVLSPTHSDTMVKGICDDINRNFTDEEWNTYIGTDIPYEQTCKAKPAIIGVKKSRDN